jgi:hypothetical protein
MLSDYSDWIIAIPLANAKELFPTFTDGCDVGASAARFNATLLQLIEHQYPGAWVNQENRTGFEVNSPDDLEVTEGFVIAHLSKCWLDVYNQGEWYVLS